MGGMLGGLLAEGDQLDAGHHGALNPAIAQAEGHLGQGDTPAHAEPGHPGELALLAQGAPRRRTVRLPVAQQTGKRRAAVALFLPQFTSFPAGQQIGGPALGRSDIALFAGAVQAGEQRQVNGKKAFRHLASLPALEGRDVRHPAGFHSPLQPLGPAVTPYRQVAAGQLHQPQALFRCRHASGCERGGHDEHDDDRGSRWRKRRLPARTAAGQRSPSGRTGAAYRPARDRDGSAARQA